MSRCKHRRVRLLEIHETVFEWLIEAGAVVSDWPTSYPTDRCEIECLDCKAVRCFSRHRKTLPRWIVTALDAARSEGLEQS